MSRDNFKFNGNDVFYDQDVQRVFSVQFCLPAPIEVKRRSVVNVKTDLLYEQNSSLPARNGLFDPRMGTLIQKKCCMTDWLTGNVCPGHTGHIELPIPVITFIKFCIEKLKMICYRCGEILLDKSLITKGTIENILKIQKGTKRFTEVLKLINTQDIKQCINPLCKCVQPVKYDYVDLRILAHFEEKKKKSKKSKVKKSIAPKKRGRKRKNVKFVDTIQEDNEKNGCNMIEKNEMEEHEEHEEIEMEEHEEIENENENENEEIENENENENEDNENENENENEDNENENEKSNVNENSQQQLVDISIHEEDNNTKKFLSVLEISSLYVQHLFQKLSKETILLIGSHPYLCHPAWMIIDNLSVCPMYVRPSVSDGISRNEDDITHKLNDIVADSNALHKMINNLRDKQEEWNINPPPKKKMDLIFEDLRKMENTVTYDVLTMMDDKTPNVTMSMQKSGRVTKGVVSRISRKEGRIRKNLMGKRSNYTARTVIVGDPYLRIDQLGVPLYICMYMNYPETVTHDNFLRLRSYVLNGTKKYPGAKQILSKIDNCLYNLKYSDLIIRAKQLRIGDVVVRHLIENDPVLFNRQPTLHRLSIMTHKIVPMSGKVFRLPIDIATPYNADFDGDEMNLHVPQCEESKNEMIKLASVPYHFISPGLSRPVVTSVQDTMLGIYRMSLEKENFLYPHEYMNILTSNCNINLRTQAVLMMNNNPKNGQQVISTICDKEFTISTKFHKNIVIEGGQFKSGEITKSIQKKESLGLIHAYIQDLGPFKARDFIDNIRYFATAYILKMGFSIGLSDMIIPKKIQLDNTKLLNDFIQQLNRDAQELHRKSKITPDELETKMNAQKIIDILGKNTHQSIDKFRNRLSDAVTCGSKGSTLNISQIIASVGQQNVDGKRITKGYTDRTFPHFTRFNFCPEANGFVKNAFLNGLNPVEFFNHAQCGREGLIDTALKTSLSGYVQRRLMKVMEDLTVHYDYTVRDCNNRVIQFFYGNKNMDTCKTETVNLPIDFHYLLTNGISIKSYCYELMFGNKYDFHDNNHVFHLQRSDLMAQFLQTFITNNCQEFFIEKVHFPFHIERILHSFHHHPLYQQSIPSNLEDQFTNDDELFEIVDNLFHYLTDYQIKNDFLLESNRTNSLRWKCFGNCETAYILLYGYLNPFNIIHKLQMKKSAFLKAIDKMKYCFQNSRVQPGDCCGVICAQSIGEPSTQLTLNTFHNSGIGSMTKITRGVPRLDEILRLTEEPKTTISKIFLSENVECDISRTTATSKRLRHLSLYQLMQDSTLQYSKEEGYLLIIRLLKWEILESGLTDRDIYLSLCFLFECNMEVFYNNMLDNNEYLNFKISLVNKHHPDGKMILKTVEKTVLPKIFLSGIPDIKATFVKKNQYVEINSDGKLEQKEKFQIVTEGTNMKYLLIHPLINSKLVTTNHIWEIITNLGSEAGRTVLIEELTDIISDGSYVNPTHIEALADMMFKFGTPISANRHGSNRGDMGPLTRSTFEESDRHLKRAAVYGESEELNSVSGNIMFGQVVPCGTGTVSVFYDEDYATKILQKICKNEEHRRHYIKRLNQQISLNRPIGCNNEEHEQQQDQNQESITTVEKNNNCERINNNVTDDQIKINDDVLFDMND